jgi:hypothetical protein
MRIAAVLVLTLAAATPAIAADAPIDTPRLLEYCEEAQKESGNVNAFRAAYCMAFIEGTLRGWEAGAFVRDAPVNYCIGSGVTLGQIMRAVVKNLRDNPAEMRGRAEVSVIAAVQKAFPCEAAR